jgi:hypothetical protein
LLNHEFIALYGDDPEWAELTKIPDCETHLRRALAGDRAGFRQLAVYAQAWTLSYSAACAFALQCELWRDARRERSARAEGHPEPLVLIRHIRRDQAVAWLGGVEREVVLAKSTIEMPAQPCGSLREWRRHRARARRLYRQAASKAPVIDL